MKITYCDKCGSSEDIQKLSVVTGDAEIPLELCAKDAKAFYASLDDWFEFANEGGRRVFLSGDDSSSAPAEKPSVSSRKKKATSKTTAQKARPAKPKSEKKARGEAKQPPGEGTSPEVIRAARAWAVKNGLIAQGQRGRLPANVLERYLNG